MLAIQERRKTVAEMYVRGATQWEIASKVGVNQGQISRDLAAIRQQWLESSLQDFDSRKAQELAKIDMIEATAWAAWDRSCQDAETTTASLLKGRINKDGTPVPDLQKTAKILKGQAGDPRFLERMSWCIDKRCEILGLNAPKKVAPTSLDGEKEWHATDADRYAILSAALAELGIAIAPAHVNGTAHGDPPTLEGPGADLSRGGA